MKKLINSISILFVFFFITISSSAQPIPIDSLYLGQKVPGSNPKAFNLEVTPGTFAAERIAISKDGSEIYYSEVKSYYPVTGDKIRYYKYENNKWSESQILFEGFFGPALSLTGDTLFVEHEHNMYFSVRKKTGWSSPKPFFSSIEFAHYLQVTNKGNYYISAKSASSVGASDWSKIQITGKDTVAKSLGFPINRVVDDQDFFIAKDESYMITCPQGPVCISYPDGKGGWFNGRYLNKKINFGISGWGAYVSPDSKFLFYTTGTKMDYSDVHVYWVSMSNIVDSMKNTNLPPYVKNKPKPQTATIGKMFSFIIPDDAVCDDDGSSIRYEVLSLDSSPMPAWLRFDSRTKTLSGTPETAGKVTLRFNAFDDKDVMTAFGIVINVLDK
ncbi:MAG: putative Ig domain-containing protein [Ignavibacteriales bacterium]|nr:putative Ig domain-containing protein [Ignavibacteriales bacterium]